MIRMWTLSLGRGQPVARTFLCLVFLCTLACAPAPAGEGQPFPAGVPRLAADDDPGPVQLFGPLAQGAASADYRLDGPGDLRFYFNYRREQYDFLERRGKSVTVGRSVAGVHQVFGQAQTQSRALRLARHGNYAALFASGRLLLSAYVPAEVGGETGLRMLKDEAPVTVTVAPRDEIHFADDFMISEGKPSQWRGNGDGKESDFAVHSLHYPALSVNAFCFMGAGRGIHAVAGEAWWDQYRYAVALRGPAVGQIGLVFAYQDEHNYGLFRWTVRTAGAAELTGRRELVRVSAGQETVLASAPGGYIPEQWYQAVLAVGYSNVTLSLD